MIEFNFCQNLKNLILVPLFERFGPFCPMGTFFWKIGLSHFYFFMIL